MSALGGPPLWGVAGGLPINTFPLPLVVGDFRLGGSAVSVNMEGGLFEQPILLARRGNREMSFAIYGADLGRPYYVGKPGPARNVPADAKVYIGPRVVFLFLPRGSQVINAVARFESTTGHEAVGVLHDRVEFDFSSGKTIVYLKLDDFIGGESLTLWGVTFLPALYLAVPSS